MVVAEQPVVDCVRLIRAEFEEMPGLILNCAQIRRMWGIDSDRCSLVMRQLADEGVVARRHDGSYARPSDMHTVREP